MRDEIVLSPRRAARRRRLSARRRRSATTSSSTARSPGTRPRTTPAAGPRFVTDRDRISCGSRRTASLKAAISEQSRHGAPGNARRRPCRRRRSASRAGSAPSCSSAPTGSSPQSTPWSPTRCSATRRTVTTYSDYRDFGGVKFPTAGHARRMGGYPVLDLAVTAVRGQRRRGRSTCPRPCATSDRARRRRSKVGATASGSSPAARTTASRSRWRTTSSSSRRRSTTAAAFAVIAQVKTARAGQADPLRRSTRHGHFDHSGGVRAAVAEGATVVTQSPQRAVLREARSRPPTRSVPTRIAQAGKKAEVRRRRRQARASADAMRDRSSSTRSRPRRHAESFLMVYLPQERILIEADAFTPRPPNAPPPAHAESEPPEPGRQHRAARPAGRPHRAAARAGRSGRRPVRGSGQTPSR